MTDSHGLKNTRRKLGIDLDGVVCDWLTAYRPLCEMVVGHSLPATCTAYDQRDWDITREQWKVAWNRLLDNPYFYAGLAPCPDTAQFPMIEFAREHQLFFVSTRPQTKGLPIETQSAAWLHWKFGLQYPTVLITAGKGELAAALGLDAFIDDKPENLLDVWQKAPNCRLFLRDAEYNQTLPAEAQDAITRVYSFAEFAQRVSEGFV